MTFKRIRAKLSAFCCACAGLALFWTTFDIASMAVFSAGSSTKAAEACKARCSFKVYKDELVRLSQEQ
jgi:hypothetical protein